MSSRYMLGSIHNKRKQEEKRKKSVIKDKRISGKHERNFSLQISLRSNKWEIETKTILQNMLLSVRMYCLQCFMYEPFQIKEAVKLISVFI